MAANDLELLHALLAAESEPKALEVLTSRGLLDDPSRWVYIGNLANNQSVVLAQQSSPAAALVEKVTNAIDAILLRRCKAMGVDPRSPGAPQSMAEAVETFFGDLSILPTSEIRKLAEDTLVLYASGSKARPCLSLYDAGEGQRAEDFPNTFCSLISGATGSSYKGAIPFVQGRFNMGGTGVLPFCSDKRRLQLIVSRVPADVSGSDAHEWAFTLFCLFPTKQDPSWKYLVGSDGKIMTAGSEPLALIPKTGAASGEVCAPRERAVASGTLIKMYDYKAPRSNVCGELYKKLDEYLLAPAIPLRIVECRPDYAANVMGVNVWDRMGDWRGKGLLEAGFEKGASISISLSTGETIPGEIRVFKRVKGEKKKAFDAPQTGLRALINGQSHAKRDAAFFRTLKVDKEHIADSMLVTLDCTAIGQDSKNSLFMSNRETFREDTLLAELLPRVQAELRKHDELIRLNDKRYQEKLENATTEEEGVNALEELLKTDPTLAELFGGPRLGRVAAKISAEGQNGTIPGTPAPFEGLQFPTYVKRRDGATAVEIQVPKGEQATVSFLTDVENTYFSRYRFRGTWTTIGDAFVKSVRLFNGRMTFTCDTNGKPIGTGLRAVVSVTDKKGSGPFALTIDATVVAPREKDTPSQPRAPAKPRVPAAPSQPEIKMVDRQPDDPPITIEKNPKTSALELHVNRNSQYLDRAREMRPEKEREAVDFVFKYGLALTVMGLIDAAKKTDDWKENEGACRDRIHAAAVGIARVIVPLCLSLPAKLPKK